MKHLRRPGASHAECDPDDGRESVDDPEEADCLDCLYAHEKRKERWYDELAAIQQVRREPTDPALVERSKRDTEPGKRKR